MLSGVVPTGIQKLFMWMRPKLSLPALALSRAAAAEVAAAVRMMSVKSSPLKHHVDVIRSSK